jgi:hypothetical protein
MSGTTAVAFDFRWELLYHPDLAAFDYCGDTHIASLLPLFIHQAIYRPSQQQLKHHSKPLPPSLPTFTKKTAPDKQNYLLETTTISPANQPMAEQADQQ